MNPHRLKFSILVAGLSLLLCGCCIRCGLRVTNHTGGTIQFYTGHTKKVVKIAAGAVVTIPHSAGNILIIDAQDGVWE